MLQNNKLSNEEKTRISKLLSKKLAPEYISYRQGFGKMMIPYIEGWTVISLANQIFGYDGWSSQIIKMEIDYCDVIDHKYNLGISCIVRITLKDGTYKEDIGFGSSENQKRKSDAYEKAKKESSTDALKRAFRQFGNSLGNCCYDKEFIQKIKKFEKKEKDIISAKDLFRQENNYKDIQKNSIDFDPFSQE